MPVTGAADRIPARIAKVVYVDAGPAPDGAAFVDTSPPPMREATERHVAEEGDGWRLPMPPWEELETANGANIEGIDDDTRQRSTSGPHRSRTAPIRSRISLRNPARRVLPQVLVSCSFPLEQVRELVESGHTWFAEMAGPQWSFVEMRSSHWPMFSTPDRLAAFSIR